MKYTQKETLQLLSQTPKGEQREKLLQNDDLRNSVLSSGANVTIYTGEVNRKSENVIEAIQNVYIGLIQRKNKKGQYDGLGALGGLAERTKKEEFESLSQQKQHELVSLKDDVIIVDGYPRLTTDIDIIRKNNVMREMREELANLGIYNLSINPDKLELICMPKVKDDNYMINIWDGKGECFAISPYCHIYEDKTGLIDNINKNAKEQIGGEASEYKKIPLIDALGAYGNIATKYKLEDGRNATKDYRYPHEYLACWALASKLLGNDDKKMVQLAISVQNKHNHPISFAQIALKTSQNMQDVAEVLNISPSTLEKMERNMQIVYQNKAKRNRSKDKQNAKIER